MKHHKEMPGTIEEYPGMQKCYGYLTSEYRYHVYLPTTIFDPKAALIRVYQPKDLSKQKADRPEIVVRRESVPLKSMPTWNVAFRCLELSRRDEQNVKRSVKCIEKILECACLKTEV